MRYAFICVLLCYVTALANIEFEHGLQSYNQGDWAMAVKHWESLAGKGETSAELEYNLGNAYFRLENVERAILHYERALRLDPSDEDTHRNLTLANRAIVDQITPIPRLGIVSAFESARDAFTPATLETLLLLFNALLSIALGGMLYAQGRLRESMQRCATILGATAVLLLLWYGFRSNAMSHVAAVVMSEKSDVYSSPTDDSTQLFSLHAGTKVVIGESLSGWTEITLADGRKGWIPANDIEQI